MNADYRQQSIISEALESQENTTQNRKRSPLGMSGSGVQKITEPNMDDQ